MIIKKDNNFILICLVFFLIVNISWIVNGYEIKDVTPGNKISKHYKQNTKCSFLRYYMCIETEIGEDCSKLSIDFDDLSTQTAPIIQNETASLISVTYELSNFGTFVASVNSLISEEFQCLELDLDSLKIDLKRDYFNVIDTSFMGVLPVAFFQLSGVNLDTEAIGSLSTKDVSNSLFFFENLNFSPFYKHSTRVPTTAISNVSNFTISIQSDTKVKEFSLVPPIGQNIFDNVYDIKTYPDIKYLKNLTLMGVSSSAVLSFKSNNSALVNSYFVNVNGVAKATQTSVVSGDNTSTTYYYSLSNYGLNDLYQLFFINNGQIKDTGIKIETNITNYSPGYYTNKATFRTLSPQDLNLVDVSFNDSKLIDFAPIQFFTDSSSFYFNYCIYPYGFSYVGKDGYLFNISTMIKPFIKGKAFNQITMSQDYGVSSFNILNVPFRDSLVYDNSLVPKIYDFDYLRVFGDVFLYRVSIKANYRFNYVDLSSLKRFYSAETLVSGDLYDGVYEFLALIYEGNTIKVSDYYEGFSNFPSVTFLANFKGLQTSSFIPNVKAFSIYNVSFLYNNLDVTDRRHYNEMYFNYPKEVPRDSSISMMISDYSILANPTSSYPIPSIGNTFYAKWDESIQMFKIEFYVEANTKLGEFSFSLYFSKNVIQSEILDNKLIIAKSGMDFLGPMFRKIKKIIPSSTISKSGSNKIGTIGWSIEIEDPINGFDNGYFVITGELDRSMYNITINSNDVKVGGNIYLGEYDITLNISAPCISQNYIITEVVLYDRVSRKSMFSVFPPIPTYSPYMSVMNPFMYLLNDSSINKVPLSCSIDPIASLDTTPPVLTSFSVSKQILDVSASNREISFTFTATDIESGIKTQQSPIVYLNTLNNRVLECKSTMISINDTSATYSCSISLPVSFGYPDNIILSVFNFVNNNGYSSGYSSSQLLELGFPYYINTTFAANEPLINGYYDAKSMGGDLFLGGRCLDGASKVNIVYYDGSTSSITPIILSSTIIKVPNVKATDKKFKVSIKTSTFTSNTITVTPVVYDYYLPISEPTLPPTVTPVPTNAPQSCPGKPECGGPSNGKCITNQGCVCYSPWIGIDCLSQIIVIDPPQSNDTSPSTNITLPTIDVKNSTVTYKSLINLVSIREIDIYGNLIYNKSFDKWQVTDIDSTTFIYNTSLVIDKDNKTPTTTTSFKVTLKWFTNKTTIKFANEELIMNPSSMKYTIEISNYPFLNSLNQLQLVMSALIESNTTEDICSSKEFGETTQGDNSNYLKIQVDNHSLYGRFIRRGIIDSNIRTITNTLLDKDMNPITSTTSLQSYIGIQIPNYKDLAIIDPDFSVLIDSNKASSNSNSICSNKSKLSAAKIAGIAVGATAFVAVIGISVTYYFMKKSANKNLISKINKSQEMNKIN